MTEGLINDRTWWLTTFTSVILNKVDSFKIIVWFKLKWSQDVAIQIETRISMTKKYYSSMCD